MLMHMSIHRSRANNLFFIFKQNLTFTRPVLVAVYHNNELNSTSGF